MDFIFIEELRLETLIGVYGWERHRRQTIQLDLEIGLRGGAPAPAADPAGAPGSSGAAGAARSDDVADTVDYGKVCDRLRKLAAESEFALIEALAEEVARVILGEFHAAWVKVRVSKLGMMRDARRVGIVIHRTRQPA